jgi:hypothetical protein
MFASLVSILAQPAILMAACHVTPLIIGLSFRMEPAFPASISPTPLTALPACRIFIMEPSSIIPAQNASLDSLLMEQPALSVAPLVLPAIAIQTV